MKNIIPIAALTLAAVALAVSLYKPQSAETAQQQPFKESTYERIMRTGTIRCGYFIWPPSLIKDPNSGKLSGIFYDYLNELGNSLGLKVEWTQELAFGTFLQDIKDQRVDMECTGGWPNPTRGKIADYTMPVFYAGIGAFVAEDDHRFDSDQGAINKPDIRVVTIDGELSSYIKQKKFPDAKDVSLPQNAMASEMIIQVSDKKADIAITDFATGFGYMKANPGKVRLLTKDPLMVMPNNLTIRQGEPELRNMINIASQHLINSGVIANILKKYDDSGAFLRVVKPYELSDSK